MSTGLATYRPSVNGTTHMVSAGHYLATAAGYSILEQGGNAIDAGVASGIAINVTLPHATNFGGVAPIMIYHAESDSVVTISGLGRWPRAASLEYFNEKQNGQIPVGILRSVVPSAPDAWLTALENYGSMTFEQVVSPALSLAQNGFPLSGITAKFLGRSEETGEGNLSSWESTRAIFMPNNKILREGDILIQKDLASTFKRLIEVEKANAYKGRESAIRSARDYFYKGDIAEEMTKFSEQQGGFFTLDDFKDFSVKMESPVKGSFKEYSIFTCGPWCQGPIVAQTLQMLESDDLSAIGHNSSTYIHLVSQALNLSFSDRHHYYGDPDFVDVPIEGLLSKSYTRTRRDMIDMSKAFSGMPDPGNPWAYQKGTTSKQPAQKLTALPGEQDQDTSYTCVVDSQGNAFSATPSDGLFGSPIVPGLGFLISNRGSQSWLDPEHPSSVQPWKRPRLTPNPAIAFKNNKLFMPFGTPGGDAQCPSMVQMFINIVEFGMNPQKAIETPRFVPWNFPNSFWPHTYVPGLIHLENRISEKTKAELSGLKHNLTTVEDWSPTMGALSGIVVDHEYGILRAGADPRRDTYAFGK